MGGRGEVTARCDMLGGNRLIYFKLMDLSCSIRNALCVNPGTCGGRTPHKSIVQNPKNALIEAVTVSAYNLSGP